MTSRLKRGAIPLVLAAGSLVLALAQDPGAASSDTKIDLHVDPSRFLSEVAAPWNDSLGLGGVWSGQYSGYLWPMGPFYALGDLLGLSPWLIQRLWLAALLALAAWGTVRLVDELYSRDRGVAHLIAGAAVVLNPYVVVFANRTSITLLAYAALPWLLIATRRGLRSPPGLWWPAAFALIVASAGGGINAASLAWILVGPALLVAYELAVLRTSFAAVRAFVVRAVPLSLLASLWWVVATGVHASYGFDFLRFTEQPSAIWHTTSLTESLRGLGFWLTYTELDFDRVAVPAFANVGPLFFDPPVVVASLLLPAFGVTGFLLARRRPYAPLLLGMAIAGALIMAAGYPEGAPLRLALTDLYESVQPTQFLRTTYKAGPLVMIGLGVLAGLAADAAWRRVPRVGPRALGAVAAAVVLGLAAWPLVSGQAVDEPIQFDYPPSWERAAADLDRTLPEGTRSLVLPGSLFGFHSWGGTTDPALAPLTREPSASRHVVPYSDPRATDLLWTVDGLVEEGRAFPGQLPPLVDLMGAGAVIAPFDYDPRRSGSVPPADAARALSGGGLESPARDYGPVRRRAGSSFALDGALALPELRRFDAGGAGPVRVHRRDPATVVDGSAGGVAALAAFGALPRDRPLLYAADQSPAELRRLAARGASFVISDSNRRRAFQNTRLRASPGRTLDPGDAVAGDATVIDPFEEGPISETTAAYPGARWVRGNPDVNFNAFPERRPALALDGDERTAWIASGFLSTGESPYLDVGFAAPRDVREVELLPYGDTRGRPIEVRIAGRTHPIRRGWNRLRVNLRDVGSLRVAISRTEAPERGGAPGGVRELRIPGFRTRERLRTPTLSARALRGVPVAGLTVLAERTTAYLPWRLGTAGGALQARDPRDRADSEQRIERVVELPSAQSFRVDAWVSSGADTPDAVLQRLAGVGGRFSGSEPYDGVPGRRAWRAFDGRPSTGWIGAWRPGKSAWLAWTAPRTTRVSSLRLGPPRERVRLPSRVRLVHDGRRTGPVTVGADGLVELPRPVSGRRFRLEILATRNAPRSQAVGIGELSGRGIPRAEARAPRSAIRGRCGDASVRIDGRPVGLRPAGTVADVEAGRPLRALGCRPIALNAGRHALVTSRGPLRTDLLRLDSQTRSAEKILLSGGPKVLDQGSFDRGEVRGARLALNGPSMLVLLQSYNRGWRAECDGRDLGPPEPVDGFANGWPVETCREASFKFGPGRTVAVSYAISALAALVLIALLLLRRPGAPAPEPAGPASETPPRRWPLGTALAIGVGASVVLGFVFAWRAGVVLGPLVALVLWRGIGARELAAASAALLGLVVPAIYLIKLPEDLGGYNSSYANDLLSAHWVAVGAVACAGLAAWRAAAEISRARSGPAAGGAPPPA